ncbi:uroporphyrinogen-III synthase [Prescottella subtropica]|uniref:uroporphyrinogen-III synthase n=1 Tax=Prescottella subtropica TaxID=2545757 RepID=UPI0010FA05A9|nr:uroporphyrinogen-III synthase [Prescottella subtropica]
MTTAELAGFTVGVTAFRRADEFVALLERRGATVVRAPAIRIVPLADDTDLARATDEVIARPPDVTVAMTAVGFRGWIGAADGWGRAEPLLAALGAGRIVARGPKVTGAVRAAELREAWAPASESSTELLDRLVTEGVAGRRIAVQLHGETTPWEPGPDVVAVLRAAGADVIAVPVYRWTRPEDPAAVDRLIAGVCAGGLDAVAFTSAPAVASILQRAKDTGVLSDLLHGFGERVLAACVGSVTAAPLTALGVPTTMPERSRLGALARHLTGVLPQRALRVRAGDHDLRVCAGCVVVDDRVVPLSPAATALLRRLAERPGVVVSRADLLAALPGGSDDPHAVETAIARLRSHLGAPDVVQTVVKRGYRLAIAPDDYDRLAETGRP